MSAALSVPVTVNREERAITTAAFQFAAREVRIKRLMVERSVEMMEWWRAHAQTRLDELNAWIAIAEEGARKLGVALDDADQRRSNARFISDAGTDQP